MQRSTSGSIRYRRTDASRQNAEPAGGAIGGNSAERTATDAGENKLRDTIAAVVLSIAAVATAWSAYQSTRWSGVMATDFNQAGALRSESVRASTTAGQEVLADIVIAADWLIAHLSDNEPLANELRVRMSPELEVAMQAWLGDWTPDQPVPSGGPFASGAYASPGVVEAAELERQAEARFASAREANQRSDNYVLTGVVFALALFFAGISSRMRGEKHPGRLVFGAAVLLSVGLVLLLIQPKSIGI